MGKSKSEPLNLSAIRADLEVAQRKPSLMEIFGYEWGHRLLKELERLQALELEVEKPAVESVEPPKLSRRDREAIAVLRSDEGPSGLDFDDNDWRCIGGSLAECEMSADIDPLASILKWAKNRNGKAVKK